MKASRDMLEDQLQDYEKQLASLSAYLKELKDMTARHGTDKEHFEGDVAEAEHNVLYYKDEIARIKQELSESANAGRPQTGADTILPRTKKQGLGSLIISSISFVAGALLGSRLKSRRGSADKEEEKGGQ